MNREFCKDCLPAATNNVKRAKAASFKRLGTCPVCHETKTVYAVPTDFLLFHEQTNQGATALVGIRLVCSNHLTETI